MFEGPCNRRQIYNIKARTKPGGQALPKANFADQVAALEELQYTLPFLQLIVRQSQRVPIINLYTEDQINDLKGISLSSSCSTVHCDYIQMSLSQTAGHWCASDLLRAVIIAWQER